MAKKIGIIGGMGPAAGCDLYEKILKLTPAKCDQEHIHIILDSNINIPDRTAYIMDVEKQKMLDGKGPTPGGSPIITQLLEAHEFNNPPAQDFLPEMKKSAKMLEGLGCDALSMPCVTGHYFEDELINSVNIPFISITEAVTAELVNKNSKATAVFVTNGSLCGQIFRPHLEAANIKPVYPDMAEQKLVMDLIYKYVKHGNTDKIEADRQNVLQMMDNMRAQGADSFILGCTEIPIAFKLLGIEGDDIIDSTMALARATVNFAMHN